MEKNENQSFFGIVEYGVVNEFEKILYKKWTKCPSGMEIWSIEKMLCWI